MSAPSLPMPFLVARQPAPGEREVSSPLAPSSAPDKVPGPIVRRPTMQQGRALETLSHAIEYLVDSRMFLVNAPYTLAESDAVRILSRCSCEVFATCAEVVPVRRRLLLWASRRLRGSPLQAPAHSTGHIARQSTTHRA